MDMIKIFYIDDEVDTKAMQSRFDKMEQSGFEIIKVREVQDVLPKLREVHLSINLIILDNIMPPRKYYGLKETNGGSNTGLRLLKDIRQEFQKIPVIFISINDKNDEIVKELNDLKVFEYIKKDSIDTNQLIHKLKQFFEK
jgi:CheY-like chemotaxis protein